MSNPMPEVTCDELREQLQQTTIRAEAAEEEVRDLRDQVEHWKRKATCYGNMVHGCSKHFAEAGFPLDEMAQHGAVGEVGRQAAAMGVEIRRLRAALQASIEQVRAARGEKPHG